MSKQGYIKLHRQIQDCWIWTDDDEKFDKRSAWIDLLLLANHKNVKIAFDGKLIVVERGQHITSIRKLATRWNWSTNKVTRFLDLLASDQMIIRESDTKKTLITIVNYDVYQFSEDSNETLTRQQRDTNETATRLNNNDKNVNNEKNNNTKGVFAEDSGLNEAIKDFIAHRRKLRKPMTDKAIDLFINRLNKLASNPKDQIELINTAIERGWQTVYPKNEKKPKAQSSDNGLLDDIEQFYLSGGKK